MSALTEARQHLRDGLYNLERAKRQISGGSIGHPYDQYAERYLGLANHCAAVAQAEALADIARSLRLLVSEKYPEPETEEKTP